MSNKAIFEIATFSIGFLMIVFPEFCIKPFAKLAQFYYERFKRNDARFKKRRPQTIEEGMNSLVRKKFLATFGDEKKLYGPSTGSSMWLMRILGLLFLIAFFLILAGINPIAPE